MPVPRRKPGSAKGVPKPQTRVVDPGFPGRLRAAMELRPGVGVPQLALEARCTGAVLWNYLNGKNRAPEALLLFAIADALRVSPRWLLTGNGDIHAVESISPEEARALNTFNQLKPAQRDLWISQGEGLRRLQEPAEPSSANPFRPPSFSREQVKS